MPKRTVTKTVEAKPEEFRGRLWCVVNGEIYCYASRPNFPGEWAKQDGFRVTGPNAAGMIHGLFQQKATDFPLPAGRGCT